VRAVGADRYNGSARIVTVSLHPIVLNQLTLDLGAPPPPTFDNFVAGDNLEALASLRGLIDARGGQADHAKPARGIGSATGSRFVYLWGLPASGRSHLLQALASATQAARLLTPSSDLQHFDHDPSISLWLVDDCDRLDAARQASAFHLFNAIQTEAGAAMVSAGSSAPMQLPVIPELATRLGWGLVFQLHRLSDQDIARALAVTLAERGVTASTDLIPWLMTRTARDLGQLRAMIDRLDRFALARKRAITVPLVREFLQATPGEYSGHPEPPASGSNDMP
jgi:DnaA-homolog protein